MLDRLLTPLVLADSLEFLETAIAADGASAELAQRFLDEALPKIRRDAAGWVHETHAWSDTWALWAIARRPAALARLQPFALAIADAYAYGARRTGHVVRGSRFPFHGVPLASASAQLASGLVALGLHPKLAGALAGWVRAERHPDGGWGDGDGPSDLPTTLVAADLLGSLDPDFDTGPTADWLASVQRVDGWWRACGPEATWLSIEIGDWLATADQPFAERFRWPHLAVTNRDRRTGLPFYGYYADLDRLGNELPSLGAAATEVAFIDLAGFGAFNNKLGMAQGDEALRAFAQALDRIPGSMAIRDGGDEFIVVGAPTGAGLPARMAAFRAAWPGEFRATFGDVGMVAPRILTATTTGSRLVAARDELGLRIAELKKGWPTVAHEGVQVDLGVLG